MSNLFVISDLHLGGRPHRPAIHGDRPGSQINSSYRHLTDFIDWLASGEACEGEVELVINGDIVDFLLDDDYGNGIFPRPWTEDEEEAIAKLEKIVERTREGRDRGPFEAMRDFLRIGHSLTLIIGNHDIELSLPRVRQHVSLVLGGKKRNLNFIYDGEAFIRGNLLIEHGNRYDRFNIVNHSALRQERSAMSRRLPLFKSTRTSGRFKPPAGSVLVIEVFNRLKREFRFLDLLKPETSAAIPTLLALHPKLEHVLSALLAFSKVSSRLISSSMLTPAEPRKDGQLTANNSDVPLSLIELLRQELNDKTELFKLTGFSNFSQLGAVHPWDKFKALARNISIYLMDTDNLFFKWRTTEARREQFLVALRNLYDDPSFQLDRESPEYFHPAQVLAKNGHFSTIIFGHTHLPKQFDIIGKGVFCTRYINTGSWADMILIPKEILSDNYTVANKAFDLFFQKLQNNQLDNYISRCLSYAQVSLDDKDQVVNAELHCYVDKDRPREAPSFIVEET